GRREGVAIVASEENEQPVIIKHDRHGPRRYCVLFDPLDGSSNLDVCGAVGTIFSILRQDRRAEHPEASLLQPGSAQVAAGYVLYGSSTVFTLTLGRGVRSEEHTSELQSRENLVCRLLLEKKKRNDDTISVSWP